MRNVLVMGAGKIGSLIGFLLAYSNYYHVYLADTLEHNPLLKKLRSFPNISVIKLNATDEAALDQFLKKHEMEAIVSSLPYYHNLLIAKIAHKHHLHYFDLTEDVQTTQAIRELAAHSNKVFVPQCGLAPGFISIIANDLMQHFPQLDTVKLRVGALPTNISNALQYSLTWSTDGLINEYGNPCHAIEAGEELVLQPLEGLEQIKIDGLTYEAFNTSGGIGSLVETYRSKVRHLSYKTIRYPGHCEKMKFLMNDLRLNARRDMLKSILEQALPKTKQDVVLVYVSVSGIQDEQYIEENYVRKFYPKKIGGHRWSAIQLTTASGICAIVDLILHTPEKYRGFIKQEQFSMADITQNRFGEYYL